MFDCDAGKENRDTLHDMPIMEQERKEIFMHP